MFCPNKEGKVIAKIQSLVCAPLPDKQNYILICEDKVRKPSPFVKIQDFIYGIYL